jgi:hypothetical protein
MLVRLYTIIPTCVDSPVVKQRFHLSITNTLAYLEDLPVRILSFMSASSKGLLSALDLLPSLPSLK